MAENRRHTANYVEARAVLMPAVDFFGRAVQIAQDQNRLTGELLAFVSYLYFSIHIVLSTSVERKLLISNTRPSVLRLVCLWEMSPL